MTTKANVSKTVERVILFLIAGFASSFYCAFIYVIFLKLNLQPSDSAYSHSLKTVLSDPFVISIGTLAALISGSISSILMMTILWNKSIFKCFLLCNIITSCFIAFGCYVGKPRVVIFGAPLVFLLSGIACRLSRIGDQPDPIPAIK